MTRAGGRASVGGFIERVRLAADVDTRRYPFSLPVVAQLARPGGLALAPGVTFLVGENGTGKSTLVEAIAVAAGFNADGCRAWPVVTRSSFSSPRWCGASETSGGGRGSSPSCWAQQASASSGARFSTPLGELSSDVAGRRWAGPVELVAALDAYPVRPHRRTPVARLVAVDPGDEEWAFLHGLSALAAAGIAVEVIAAPSWAENLPPGAVA